MIRSLTRLTVVAGMLSLLAFPALAVGPVDGEVGAVYWANNFDSSGGASAVSSDAGAPGFRAELWVLKKYGFRAGMYSAEVDDLGGESSDYTSVDLMWRAFSPSEGNFFAFGAGWQEMDLDLIGLDGDTSGVRLSLEGRVALGLFYLYGQGSYLPSLEDAPASSFLGGEFRDLEGQELEVGASLKMAPFVSLRAGYRMSSVDFTRASTIGPEVDGEVDTDGFLVGLSVRF